jgi:hypothetical protein
MHCSKRGLVMAHAFRVVINFQIDRRRPGCAVIGLTLDGAAATKTSARTSVGARLPLANSVSPLG